MLTQSAAALPTIMEPVSHVDPETTLKVYTHGINNMNNKSVNQMNGFHKKTRFSYHKSRHINILMDELTSCLPLVSLFFPGSS